MNWIKSNIVLLVFAALVGLGIAILLARHSADREELERQATEATKRAEEKESEALLFKGKAESLETQTAPLLEEVRQLQDQISAIRSQRTQIEVRYVEAKNTINAPATDAERVGRIRSAISELYP